MSLLGSLLRGMSSNGMNRNGNNPGNEMVWIFRCPYCGKGKSTISKRKPYFPSEIGCRCAPDGKHVYQLESYYPFGQ